MKCPECGFENHPDASACRQCGEALEASPGPGAPARPSIPRPSVPASPPSISPGVGPIGHEGPVGDRVNVGNYVLQTGSIQGGAVRVSTPARRPHVQPRPTPVFIRPSDFPGLVGRDAEVRAATTAIRSATPVAVQGSGGVGKTTFLRHLAHHFPDDSFPDGVLFLSAFRPSVEDVLQFLYDAFYQSDTPLKVTDDQVRQALQRKRALVILDDADLAWHHVQRLMEAAPGSSFVLASAERRPWGEGLVLVLRGLSPEDGLELLERGMGRALTPEERIAAQALCVVLEGHPLHILQAAALAREGYASLAAIAHRLATVSPAEFLTAQVLVTLSEPDLRVLAVLAALGDVAYGAGHVSALADLPDAGPAFELLERRGLVQAHSERYSLAGSLGKVLRSAWDETPWAERALGYFSAWAERQRQAPEWLLEEADVILRALGWAVGAGHWAEVVRLGRTMSGPLALSGRWSAWAQVLRWVLQAAEELEDRAVKAWALHQLGTRALCLGDTTTARTALIQALRLRETLGDQTGAGITRDNLDLLVGAPPPPESRVQPPSSPPTPAPAFPSPPPSTVRSAIAGVPPVFLGCAVILFMVLVTLGGVWVWQLRPRSAPPTPTPTSTPTLTATPTSTPTPADTPTSTPTPTATPTNTPRPTATPTYTPTPTTTSTPTHTPTPTNTPTPTSTPTSTPTPTATPDRVGPPPPQLLAPDQAAQLLCPPGAASLGVQLQWLNVTDPSGIRSYEVRLEAIERNPSVYPRQFPSATFLDVLVPCGEVYRWWVRGLDGEGNVGEWSQSRTFSVLDTTGPSAPALIVPENGAEIACTTNPKIVTLRWAEVEDPSGIAGYVVELEVVVVGTAPGPTPVPISTDLLSGTGLATSLSCGWDYRWRVQAEDGSGNAGAWSAWSTFRVVAPTG